MQALHLLKTYRHREHQRARQLSAEPTQLSPHSLEYNLPLARPYLELIQVHSSG
jgi:hypothetical protein